MEQLYETGLFSNVSDIQDFLTSSIISEDQVIPESSSFSLYDQNFNLFFDDKEEVESLDQGLTPVTKTIQKTPIDKKKYQNISNELRLELIDAVKNKKEKIKHAAKRLGINYSSAKYIYQVYKKEGRRDKIIFKRKSGKEVLDQNHNMPIFKSTTSSIFSTQTSGLSNHERDKTVLYGTNCVTPKNLLTFPVQQGQKDLSEENKGILTEKIQLTNSVASTVGPAQPTPPPVFQAYLPLTVQAQSSESVASQNSPSNQLKNISSLNSFNPMVVPIQAVPVNDVNGMYFAVPQNCLLPYPIHTIAVPISNNQNIPFIPNIEPINPSINNTISATNIRLEQYHLANQQSNVGTQPQNVHVMHPSVYMPPYYNIGLPFHPQLLPPNGQIYVPSYNNIQFSPNGNTSNPMAIQTETVLSLENHNAQSINNPQDKQITNRNQDFI